MERPWDGRSTGTTNAGDRPQHRSILPHELVDLQQLRKPPELSLATLNEPFDATTVSFGSAAATTKLPYRTDGVLSQELIGFGKCPVWRTLAPVRQGEIAGCLRSADTTVVPSRSSQGVTVRLAPDWERSAIGRGPGTELANHMAARPNHGPEHEPNGSST
jgi:hypothetical protein